MKLAEVCGETALNRKTEKTNDMVVLQRNIRAKSAFFEKLQARAPGAGVDREPGEAPAGHQRHALKKFG
ncbi:hypothetical protein [Roseibium aggregatum]|uniref:hypothetical protein n=1 Tax=Roseibium aggregatum TaxID=187304 RepID=UPI0012F489DF|nr:hypothetical protein [Roseibium aggregatum]